MLSYNTSPSQQQFYKNNPDTAWFCGKLLLDLTIDSPRGLNIHQSHCKSKNNVIVNNEQYHQKLKHNCNFDKKQRLKTNVFVNKTIYSAYTCKKPFCEYMVLSLVFDLCFLSKLQLCLSFWWYCSLLNFMPEMIFSKCNCKK